MNEKFELQSVAGRWCERSINDMEYSALVHITNEVSNKISGDMGLVALLADYVRMGREYGDMMNSDSKNMKDRIAELEKENKKLIELLKTVMGSTTCYPTYNVLKILSDASESLLGRYGYDGDGWEIIQYAIEHARKRIEEINAAGKHIAQITIKGTGK